MDISIAETLKDKIQERVELGKSIYGWTLEENNEDIDWVDEAMEELVDALFYLEKWKRTWNRISSTKE